MRLYSGAPFWLLRDGLREWHAAASLPPACDATIIGAGITGALVADALAAEGIKVVILDRRAPASGSTAASTALLSYEIDVSLTRLSDLIGTRDAVRAYQLSFAAIDWLADTAASLPEPCGFARRTSLYLASRARDRDMLEREAALRQCHDLDAEFWPRERVAQTYGFPGYGALRTTQAGVIDPIRFTRTLLERAARNGATLVPRTEATEVQRDGNELVVTTPRGSVRSRWAVYAMGYETPPQLTQGLVTLHSTYALVTEPLDDLGPWSDESLVWETGRPYYYMRVTDDRRIMIGGADAPFKDPDWRDRLLPARTKRLERRLRQWLPSVPTQTAFAWSGTFGETEDGLPLIGPLPAPECGQVLFALGYGANGITFGAVAARILRDFCLGGPTEDAQIFRLDRRA